MAYDYIINGEQTPSGLVKVSGAKNSAIKLLAGSLLTDEVVRLQNFPTQLVDVVEKIQFMKNTGSSLYVNNDEDTIELKTTELVLPPNLSYDVPIRTTYLLAAGQLIRNAYARIPYPGGCKIGSRGYDLHIKVWESLGCTVQEKTDYIEIAGHLHGSVIDFPISTVGGTENALLCGAVAEGVTEIRNAYITPEIEDLIIFLQRMGANIRSFGNSLIRIEGNSGLLRGVSYSVMLDRIEALTWIVFTAITKGNVIIEGIPFQEMEVPLLHLKNAGIEYFQNRNSIYIVPDCFPPQGIQPFEIACGTYPGVVSDMQPFFVLLGIKANGLSRVFDYRYPERMAYAKELDTFNPGSILAEPGKITIKGSDKLYGATVQSTDLRGSMTMVMAAFNAKGCSVVKNVQMAMRGYNNLTSKLRNLGLTFEVVER